MMSFVLVTPKDNVIVIDGDRSEDMPLLKEYIGGRHISIWILTHAHKAHITHQGEAIQIGKSRIDFLFSYHEELTSNLMNDSSLVFKLTTPNKTVLFLSDLGHEAGDILFRASRRYFGCENPLRHKGWYKLYRALIRSFYAKPPYAAMAQGGFRCIAAANSRPDNEF